MPIPDIHLVSDHIYWSYANLARAHAALNDGVSRYKPVHHIIRSKLFHGLKSGKMSIRSLYDDERMKMTLPQCCMYCGETKALSIDHLMPRIKGGLDVADNLVWACRSCNSSKCDEDLLRWMKRRGRFPGVLLLRRYMKLVHSHCTDADLLGHTLAEVDRAALPFSIDDLPYEFPPLGSLVLWVQSSGGSGGVRPHGV